jgi:hypothetical protein
MPLPATNPTLYHYRNDLWEEGLRTIGPILVQGVSPATACLSCRIQFRKEGKETTLGHELNSLSETGCGTITIVDGATYEFEILDQALPLDHGRWKYEFETFEGANCTGISRTWIKGIMVIIKDVGDGVLITNDDLSYLFMPDDLEMLDALAML